jgi:2-polyprenyl-6-methoxyphenol hydroxylase-like FAD-dependent oxidoreductase
MNTGIQDAINLAWKLAMHIQRVAPRALLDTYETERGSVARRLVHGTMRFTRLTLLRAPVATAARRRIAPLVLSRPAVRQRIALAISQTDVS